MLWIRWPFELVNQKCSGGVQSRAAAWAAAKEVSALWLFAPMSSRTTSAGLIALDQLATKTGSAARRAIVMPV